MSSLGFNTGYIDDLYKQYLDDPNSISESWREFFADYRPTEGFVAAAEARQGNVVAQPAATPAPAPVQTKVPIGDGAPVLKPASAPAANEDEADVKKLRGASARIVENMEASIGVPTATSVRTFHVKLMEENRKLINDYQRYVGGNKVSFTHIIAWAVVKALAAHPTMYSTFRRDGDTLQHVQPHSVNLGLAIDVEKRGKRTLMVPNVKGADKMNFAQFLGIYNDIVRRARDNKLEISDFQGTTASLTNPGMIGTVLSVPRLMEGQGVIVGVGAIAYPPEYSALTPLMASRLGISKVMTLTSTYDHRVIQGAESGAFLKFAADLLTGGDFYQQLFADLGIPYQPYTMIADSTSEMGASLREDLERIRKQAAVLQLIRAYRVRGHLYADVNPLGYEWSYHPDLDPATYGLTLWDLDREFITGDLGGEDLLPLREILTILRETYTRTVGIEYMHLSNITEKRWLQERLEPVRAAEEIDPAAKKRMVSELNAAEAFEQFLHKKYIGHKRFSLEGSETMIPILDAILSDAADQEVQEAVIGMAHRGRLNVLANIMNKPYEAIFSEFEGNIDPATTQGSGDVKYHLGALGTHTSPSGATIQLELASNPSHLEAVNPVVEGMVRAKQELKRVAETGAPKGDYLDAVLPILIHGDAAFAGQGVVAETLNLSQLRGYKVGGTVHLVVNNQIGFTTTPSDARSTLYATDLARMIQAPIFHVNGDDPEACVRVARLAFDYRQVFNKDVVIDMLCYRVHGHNEGDEPTYTQPQLYAKIAAKRSVRKIYTELLLRRGDLTPEEAEQILDDYHGRLQEAFERTKEMKPEAPADAVFIGESPVSIQSDDVDTTASRADLEAVVEALVKIPDDFNIHRKLERQFKKRDKLYHDEHKVDWGFAEALAFGTLLAEGTLIRISGQDSRRGTFSHRHAVLYDQETGAEYIPLNNVREGQSRLLIYDSLLSEYAACGFEYGYSVANPEALVLWEAQFGDFSNGAQIVYDQFLSAAEEKWGQTSSLVLLLPHGYEGQGPEHSSARLERFLQLCAENNMIVANITSPANYFHALRRQVKRDVKKPLVVMSPKSLLRHPMAISQPEEFYEGGFQKLIPATADPATAKRLVFCSGKVYYDLIQKLDEAGKQDEIAVARMEQLYPFPEDEVRAELERYSDADSVAWMQEEPANMGAWQHVRYQIDDLLEEMHSDCTHRVGYAGRAAAASPSAGHSKVHQIQQQALLDEAMAV
ncbi:MAG: multifunctional oxoglutarate decarboxylase/oxoglutarate dehydrogenase thiamine pyrophosphate-binding subunit/dihydrolipoyllysine-residue succinyltransferase subunit [Rhodothermales bacterium]